MIILTLEIPTVDVYLSVKINFLKLNNATFLKKMRIIYKYDSLSQYTIKIVDKGH